MAITFTSATDSTTVTVNDGSHGALVGDFVTFSNANTGNSSLNTQIDGEHEIITVPTTGTYTITLSDNAAAALSSGGSADAEYQLNTGLNTVVPGNGWGAGTWGAEGWGSASTETAGGGTLRLWSQDNFGEDLIINQRDGGVFYWDKTLGTSSRAKNLIELADSPPIKCRKIIVSERDRHVIAFGSNPIDSAIQDRLLVRFSTQENPFVWRPTALNTAGDLRIGSGSEIVTAVKTRREIIVLTDTSVHSMQFIGPPFTFGLQQLSSNTTIMSPNAAVATEDFVFWMGIDTFYVYAGQTQTLPCTVKDKVFLDFNLTQKDKVVAGVNSEFSEVTWFYPSASATDNDKYVTYNYGEKVWYFGTLSRTAWLDRGTRNFPIATGSNLIYNHEIGYDDDGSSMDSFIESASIDIGDGDRFSYLRKVIPDLTFDGSTNLASPQATFTVKARNNPGADFNNTQAGTSTRTQSTPVETYTEQLDLRVRGRSFALRVESNALGSKWKLGSPRVDIRQDGRR